MSDIDGDSEMHSSGEESESELFPSTRAGNEPATPTNNDHLSPIEKLKTAELSPPTSQDPRGDDAPVDTQSRLGLEGQLSREADGGEGKAKPNDEPGWTWRNKKATEDYQRAWAEIVDKDFSLKEFGDLFGDEEVPLANGSS